MKALNIKDLDKAARAVQLPKVATSTSHNSRLSLNIVNSECNGKRIKFSKDLALAVGITENASILPMKDEGLLMVAKNLPYPAACPVKLSSNKKSGTIAYSYGMVALLTEVFGLDFSNRTSMSFGDITLDKLEDGTPVALVRISDPEDESSAEDQ